MSEEDRKKERECKKNQIHGMSQKDLPQRVEQLIQHLKELLRGLVHNKRIIFEAKLRLIDKKYSVKLKILSTLPLSY